MVHCHLISRRLAGGAARGRRRNGRGALTAMASVRQLVVVQTAGQLGLLEVGGNVLVGHLLHACLKQVVLLVGIRRCRVCLEARCIPLLRTKTGYRRQTSCVLAGWSLRCGCPSRPEGRGSEAGGGACCQGCVDVGLDVWMLAMLSSVVRSSGLIVVETGS